MNETIIFSPLCTLTKKIIQENNELDEFFLFQGQKRYLTSKSIDDWRTKVFSFIGKKVGIIRNHHFPPLILSLLVRS